MMSIGILDKLNGRKLELIEIIDRLSKHDSGANKTLLTIYRKELKEVEAKIEAERKS